MDLGGLSSNFLYRKQLKIYWVCITFKLIFYKQASTNHQSFSGWFCDVQSLSTWTHSQLTAFGTRLWMGKEPCPNTVIKNDTITKKITTKVLMNNIFNNDESFSSKFDKLDAIQRQISEQDTMSEISHTLAHDDDFVLEPSEDKTNDHNQIRDRNEYVIEQDTSAVNSVVHAQDIITRTQKEHFDKLITCIGGKSTDVK